MTLADEGSARERRWTCARRLRERRRELGLTQVDVVSQLRLRGAETSNRNLSAMENGRGLDLCMIPDLAAVLDCSITYLFGLTEDPYAWQPDLPLCGATARAQTASGAAPPRPTAPQPAAPKPAPLHSRPGRSWILGPDIPDSRAEESRHA